MVLWRMCTKRAQVRCTSVRGLVYRLWYYADKNRIIIYKSVEWEMAHNMDILGIPVGDGVVSGEALVVDGALLGKVSF